MGGPGSRQAPERNLGNVGNSLQIPSLASSSLPPRLQRALRLLPGSPLGLTISILFETTSAIYVPECTSVLWSLWSLPLFVSSIQVPRITRTTVAL